MQSNVSPIKTAVKAVKSACFNIQYDLLLMVAMFVIPNKCRSRCQVVHGKHVCYYWGDSDHL